MKWLINGIFREYSRVIMFGEDNIRISLYVDSEYYKALEILNNLDEYNKVLGLDI